MRPARSMAASLFGNRSVAHSIFIIISGSCTRRSVLAERRCRDGFTRTHAPVLGWLKYPLDAQTPQTARHDPLDLVPFAIAEECRTERSQHRDASRAEIRLRRKHQHQLTSLSALQVQHLDVRVHGDHIARYPLGLEN